MISNKEYYKTIVSMVPQWFISDHWAPHEINLNIKGDDTKYYISAYRNATPIMHRWKEKCEHLAEELLQRPSTNAKSIDEELIQATLVKEWLDLKGYVGDWERLFDYSRMLENRTYENSDISFTFIYNQKHSGDFDLLDNESMKILDVLGETQFTFFRIGKNWDYVDYDYVKWDDISDSSGYELVPQFVYPYKSILNQGECAITKTKRGDLIIYDGSGLLASCRKGEWKIYDPQPLKNAIVDHVGIYRIGCNLFEILFDLSYRRHGALILIDTDNVHESVVSNQSSIINHSSSPLYQTLSERLNSINIQSGDRKSISKELILELASVDGAIIFDAKGDLIAFGAMVNSHPDADGELGARSLASLSAHLHGMKVFKVSSDGQITLYYNNKDDDGEELVKLEFL
ncbi:diadenylate cyclase [Halobacillus sp. Cin3]|uniref:diadenylate cyclase n=1 Tax=Halobacillus sp. Cin3 TaxID=2928441 RepID=UPI00248EB6F5|nr:diadenylate cyclase [Halobacillus sp. Cin3]